MLKKRIIPVELLNRGRLVKTVAFGSYRDVGDPLKSSQVYSDQDADELILLNIDRERRDVRETANYLRKITGKCFMPVAAGGGISTIDDAKLLFDSGADKVVVNSSAYISLQLLERIASRWGSQALVISMDVMRDVNGSYLLKSDCGRKAEDRNLFDHIQSMIKNGAGEILINSIDNDGMMNGYDCGLISVLRPVCSIPMIICGGAGGYPHLKDAFDLGVNAVACGSLFNFGDNNPLRAKAFLKNYNIPLKQV
jgi:cyclase